MNINEKRIYKADDKYLYDLNVRVKENPDPGQYQYMVKADYSTYIQDVLRRSYYRFDSIRATKDEVCITTNCEPDAFKMVFERALMDKYRDDTGAFALTANEINDFFLAEAILDMSERKAYVIYNSFD